jgi:hypothetical protein
VVFAGASFLKRCYFTPQDNNTTQEYMETTEKLDNILICLEKGYRKLLSVLQI